ncbi:Rap1a/Tai family immunity protein [Curvibacter sp. HBC61]|uniref:Rap1a/Tai family immunity protein n=1 Tax=Curvibacter cyanobacteriorum TaxID=3026422 RepID=A0ABT5MVL0_9BURK|nr:Rap1a/Tai family immunity protein [Curvibacter sp. HBC61]MDD0838094.1 Rap1a/Tai family immunity protein [Curvibacter sp. HBC61]
MVAHPPCVTVAPRLPASPGRPAGWVRWLMAGCLAASLGSPTAQAQFIDGNELNRWGEAFERRRQGLQSSKDGRDVQMFMGYVMGVWDATLAGRDILCLPNQFESAQIYDLVVDHVRAHPEKWTLPADYLVREAALRQLRCRK